MEELIRDVTLDDMTDSEIWEEIISSMQKNTFRHRELMQARTDWMFLNNVERKDLCEPKKIRTALETLRLQGAIYIIDGENKDNIKYGRKLMQLGRYRKENVQSPMFEMAATIPNEG